MYPKSVSLILRSAHHIMNEECNQNDLLERNIHVNSSFSTPRAQTTDYKEH